MKKINNSWILGLKHASNLGMASLYQCCLCIHAHNLGIWNSISLFGCILYSVTGAHQSGCGQDESLSAFSFFRIYNIFSSFFSFRNKGFTMFLEESFWSIDAIFTVETFKRFCADRFKSFIIFQFMAALVTIVLHNIFYLASYLLWQALQSVLPPNISQQLNISSTWRTSKKILYQRFCGHEYSIL